MKETEQTLLDQIKDQVSQELFKCQFGNLLYSEHEKAFINKICEKYATAKAQAINSAIGNLLAVMLGDGGDYREKHGTLKAIEDAQELLYVKWKSLSQVNDSCEATLKKASENAMVHYKGNLMCDPSDSSVLYHPDGSEFSINKQSIIDPSNIVIL